jgi:hypothetical protein
MRGSSGRWAKLAEVERKAAREAKATAKAEKLKAMVAEAALVAADWAEVPAREAAWRERRRGGSEVSWRCQ